ncbi:MAG: RNA-binding protein [Sulfuricurvum sp. PC08-66]|nr:MAG: RNA-binding protein [Sulfuricurvum sp. PC08-66]
MQDIYIGNLPYSLSENEIKELFSTYGEVSKVTLIVDRESGRKKGYGFVKMDPQGCQEAIKELNETQFMGRTIKVSAASNRP